MKQFLALSLCFLAAACGSISKDYPKKTYYAFEIDRADREHAAADAPILLVPRFRSGALSKGQGLVYRTAPSTYESDYYSEFFTEPESLLTLVTAAWMEDSGLFSVIVGGTTEVDPDYVLQGALRSLHVDQTVKGETRAVVDIQFFLSRRHRLRSEPVWHRDLQRSEPAESAAGKDVLAAWNRAISDLLAEAERELAEAFGELE